VKFTGRQNKNSFLGNSRHGESLQREFVSSTQYKQSSVKQKWRNTSF
jgi:hypothetical protein